MVNRVVAIIPAYNEEETIYDVVKRVQSYVEDVFVVDDYSIDKTNKRAIEAGAKVLSHRKNQGKWSALKTGFMKALEVDETEIFLQLDGDGQHLPEDIPRFIDEIKKGGDLIIGKRIDRNKGKMPLIRILSNQISTIILNLLFRCDVDDSQCGFRAYSKKALKNIKFTSVRYEGETKTLIKAKRLRLNIRQVPIKTIYKENRKRYSKLRYLVDLLDFLRVILTSTLEAILMGMGY